MWKWKNDILGYESKHCWCKQHCFLWCFGLIDDPFYVDVHTVNEESYIKELQDVANNTKKIVYAIYDDEALLYNRETKKLEHFGHIGVINPVSE